MSKVEEKEMKYRPCKSCGFLGCYYLEEIPYNTNDECCSCGEDKLEDHEACEQCQIRRKS